MSVTDIEYIKKIQTYDERVTEKFYHDCKAFFSDIYPRLFVRKDIMEDIFHQSFVKLWTEIETYRIYVCEDDSLVYRLDRNGRPQRLLCTLQQFLVGFARNDYLEWVRRDMLNGHSGLDEGEMVVDIAGEVFPYLSGRQWREQIVAECVEELSPRCRDILTKFYYRGMKLEDILLSRGDGHMSKNGLKSSKYKCMERLKGKVTHLFDVYKIKY